MFGVFLAQKLNHEPFTVVGDGAQKRDFIYVSDVVSAFVGAGKSDLKDEVMNVGSGDSYSINRLVKILGGDVVYVPKRPGEPDSTQADIAKIKKMLGWQPQVSFEDGVRKLLDNIDYWRNAPVWTPEKIGEATREWFKFLAKER